MSIFRKNTNIYIIVKESTETFEQYIDRGNFVASQEPGTEQDYEDIILYSHIYINNKYLFCSYNKDIMKRLDRMIEKCKITSLKG